jgi:hypothetical protein
MRSKRCSGVRLQSAIAAMAKTSPNMIRSDLRWDFSCVIGGRDDFCSC